MSSMSIQGAFGDSMRPSIQGLLGREKLPAVLVPGMKDDINSLSGLLNSNDTTGAKDKVAIFTKNGAIILTADSCKEAILSATERRHTQLTKSIVYMFSDRTCLYLLRHICVQYSPTRFHFHFLNISMDSMIAILSLVYYRTHLTSRTIHVSKLLSVTVCFYMNHPVTHW